MGIALLLLSIMETFSQPGFYSALVQKKENIEAYLNSAWTVMIIRGIILFIVLYFGAPHAAIFFNAPEAKLIIRAIGFSILFRAFTNIGVVYFQKELNFKKQFMYQFLGIFADFVVAISFSIILRNVWALVLGMLAGNIVICLASYFIHPYRPHLTSNLEKTKELWGFGRWVFGSSILVFIITQGDDIIVGKILGATMLGFYQLAYKISNTPATEISQIISTVTFPAYSEIQDNLLKLREAFLKVFRLTAFLSLPLAGLIFILAPDLTIIFLGKKWLPIVPAMQALAWWGVIRALMGATSPIFLSLGKPGIVTRLQALQAIILFVIIYPFTKHGSILGTSIAVLLSSLVTFFIRNGILINEIQCRIVEFYRAILIPILFTIFSILPIVFLKLFVLNSINTYSLLLFIGVFVLAFIIIYRISAKFIDYAVLDTLKTICVNTSKT